jgi:peptide-methionine (S)-S-oxide reductase
MLKANAAEPALSLPEPVFNPASTATTETVVFAGGCFWGMQAVFEHVKGVRQAVSGYAGGSGLTEHYQLVGTGATDHAEAERLEFNPKEVSFGQLLQIYFAVAHNPTQLNFQGPDIGTQYRSEIFYTTPRQQQIAQAYITQLGKAGVFGKPIVTRLEALQGFYPAEDYHQDYYLAHPDSTYIIYHDAPKVANLKRLFPGLYRDEPVRVTAK